MFDLKSVDPDGVLVDQSELDAGEVEEIGLLMNALAQLRKVEDELAAASSKYMELNRTDMKALHYLIVCQNRGVIATPSSLAQHLQLSAASITKLLDRLEAGGHVTRSAHPTDRRALAIVITPETRKAAMETVGKQQARRFKIAARLTPKERAIVRMFIEEMTLELDVSNAKWLQKTPE